MEELYAPEEQMSTKMRVLRDTLKRVLVVWQVFRHNLEDLRTSTTIAEWAAEAKKNKNKNFTDFRILAAGQLNSLNAMILKMKSTMKPHTWNAILSTLSSEQVKEIDLLLNEITELREDAIERITLQVKEAKIRSGIPLNDPTEQLKILNDGNEQQTSR